MIANGLNLSRHIAAENIRKRTDGLAFVVGREKCRHPRTREYLLRIPHPLQDPIGSQALMGKLEIWREVLGRFPGRNRVACGMAARALQFHKKISAHTQSLRLRFDIGGNERVVDSIQRRKITLDGRGLLFREVERRHSSR